MARRHVPASPSQPIRQELRMVADRAGGGKEEVPARSHLHSFLGSAADQTEVSPALVRLFFLDDHRVSFLAVSYQIATHLVLDHN